MKDRIIHVYEANSDGNGTPCSGFIGTEEPISEDVVKEVSDKISDFMYEMKSNGTEWETATLTQVGVEYLLGKGIKAEVIKPYTIEI